MKIPLDVGGVQESKPVPGGRYGLTIASAEQVETRETKKPQIKVSLGIDGHDEAPNVTHYIGLPAPGDDPDKAKFKQLLVARFLALFKIPNDSSGFDLDDFPGQTATAELTLSEPDDSGNIYNRLTVPRLASGEPGLRKAPPVPKSAVG